MSANSAAQRTAASGMAVLRPKHPFKLKAQRCLVNWGRIIDYTTQGSLIMFEWLFGEKTPAKKTYPVLTSEILQPTDQPITTVEAKRIFKEWMLKIGYLDKQEVGDHVGYFADEMHSYEENIKEDLRMAKDSLADETKESKEELKRIKKELASCKDDAKKAELEDELADAEDELKFNAMGPEGDIARAQELLDTFKTDKRAFLIKYVNEQVQR
jgi:hypothetical protein